MNMFPKDLAWLFVYEELKANPKIKLETLIKKIRHSSASDIEEAYEQIKEANWILHTLPKTKLGRLLYV